MASIRQRNNRWQARVHRKGFPDQVKTFTLRQDAEKWARGIETEIDRGHFTNVTLAHQTTLGDLIERYLAEVLHKKKSFDVESIRLKAMMRMQISKWSIANLSPTKIAAFRDERLTQVSAGTVIRELAYLSSIINIARREWGIHVPNPVQLVRKPSSPEGRNRTLSSEEKLTLLAALTPTNRRSEDWQSNPVNVTKFGELTGIPVHLVPDGGHMLPKEYVGALLDRWLV